jgi:hypothetical protein
VLLLLARELLPAARRMLLLLQEYELQALLLRHRLGCASDE